MKIIGYILISLFCILFTTITIVAVVIPSPTEFSSYVLLSFILLVDAAVIFWIIPFNFTYKVKPKTISKRLLIWFLIVLYCCGAGTVLLTEAYLKSAKAVVLVFDCIFGAIGLAAVVGIFYVFIKYLIIKHCLKYGKEILGEFVSVGKAMYFQYGNELTSHPVFRYSVNFKYFADGEEKTAKSARVYSLKEAEKLKNMQKFKIRYTKRTAVISETSFMHEDD